jgi:catechol 2,3-dioxygenase-like lactoylglutathione lyase family enzyme
MIIGTHAVIRSTKPDADRSFLHDVLGFRAVDGGGGYLIFGLPPAEASVHKSESAKDDLSHEVFLLCDNVEAFIDDMRKHGAPCTPVQETGWGLLTQVTLPSGGRLGVYQPRHQRPK